MKKKVDYKGVFNHWLTTMTPDIINSYIHTIKETENTFGIAFNNEELLELFRIYFTGLLISFQRFTNDNNSNYMHLQSCIVGSKYLSGTKIELPISGFELCRYLYEGSIYSYNTMASIIPEESDISNFMFAFKKLFENHNNSILANLLMRQMFALSKHFLPENKELLYIINLDVTELAKEMPD